MSGQQIAEILMSNGWILTRIKGSHHIFTKQGERSIPVPIKGNRDLPIGLVKAILRQASL